jgi:hypothetical protein
MKKIKLLLISLVTSVMLPGTNVLAEIGFMRDVNTGCGEIAVDCSTCHDLNDFDEYTDNQGIYKSDGGQTFCSDPGTWSPVRLSEDQLLKEAQLVTNAYFERLFGEFMSHMADAIDAVEDDPKKTNPFVEVFPSCPELAAEIASDYSREYGYLVRRVSNRTRNARNTPDNWQASTLDKFEEKAEEGKNRTQFNITKPDGSILPTKEFEATKITDEEDIKYFNYMRSISLPPMPVAFGGPATLPNGKPNPNLPCLKCHGSIESGDVTADLLEAIEKDYPYDMALGYKAGNIRGAWTIKIPVVEGED